eukprot:gene14431-19367_t
MNIWSHLIGFVTILIAGIQVSSDLIVQNENINEIMVLEAFFACACVCLLCSTIYHWFGCLSVACHERLLRLDLCGIALLIAGSFFPGVFYGFYCYKILQQRYLAFSFVILIIGLSAPWVNTKVQGYQLRPFIFASLVVLGFIPFTHWIMITPTMLRVQLAGGFMMMFLWYIIGFSFFILRVPEKYFPD